MSSFTNDLPKAWQLTTLGEAYQVIGGGTPSTADSDYWDGDTPWITSADIEGVRQVNIRKHVTEKGIAESTTSKVPPKTLLVVTRVGLGKIAIAETSICFSQDLQGLIQNPKLIYPEFTLYLLSYELQILKFDGRGTTISGITKKQLKDLGFPLPPIAEQHRIVAKIEELFSELDKGIENLKTARAQLNVYRQALLKHAFEGQLTAQWRAENQDKLETADALLKRIQQERTQRYQQQLADWQTSGGSKPKAPKPLPSLTADELAELPVLPEGWGWVKLGELTWSVKDGPHFSPKYVEKGIPFISGGNIRPDGVDFDKAKHISRELHEELSKRCKPEIGDVLYTKGGTTGIARVNTFNVDFNVWVHVAVLKLTSVVKPFYLQHALNSLFCYSQSQKYTHGVGNQDLGLTRMVNIVLAICSVDEQEEVIKIIDDKMSVIDQLELTITTSLQQAEALRQSILKKAVSGQLVPQDPHDEPASALLARIKAERVTAKESPLPRQRSKRG